MFDRSRTLARSEAPLDEQGGLGHRLAPLDGRAIVELRGVHAGLVDRLAVDRVDQRLHQRLEGDHLDRRGHAALIVGGGAKLDGRHLGRVRGRVKG